MKNKNELRPLTELIAMLGNPLTAGEVATELGRHRDAIIADIEPSAADYVRDVLRQLRFSHDVVPDVLFCLSGLIEFEQLDKAAIKTYQQRRADLARVIEISNSLAGLLDAMELQDGLGLVLKGHEVANEWPDYEKGRFRPIPDRIQIEALAKAASLVRNEIPSGASGGRRPILNAYARHVGRLWEAVESTGIQPGRGGDFEHLCDAVFCAAGVPAKAEGAIRHFMAHQFGKSKNKMVQISSAHEMDGTHVAGTTSKKRRKNP